MSAIILLWVAVVVWLSGLGALAYWLDQFEGRSAFAALVACLVAAPVSILIAIVQTVRWSW